MPGNIETVSLLRCKTGFDFLTCHILQESLPLILLVLKIWFRSIHKLFCTSAILYTAAHNSQTFPTSNSTLVFFFKDSQVPCLLGIIMRIPTCHFLSQGITYNLNVTWTNLFNPPSKTIVQKCDDRWWLKLHQKHPTPACLCEWPSSHCGCSPGQGSSKELIKRFM